MCGIAGAFHPKATVCSDEVLAAIRDRMPHRGPDGVGLWRSPDGRAASRTGACRSSTCRTRRCQPMANADGSVHVVFNGEIYNHAELRSELEALGKYRWTTDHSDTEVLLHAYEEWGLECVKRFYGMFAFVDLRRAQPRPAGDAPRARPRGHQAALLRAGPRAASGSSPPRSARSSRTRT